MVFMLLLLAVVLLGVWILALAAGATSGLSWLVLFLSLAMFLFSWVVWDHFSRERVPLRRRH